MDHVKEPLDNYVAQYPKARQWIMYENMIQYPDNMMTMMKDLLERLIAQYHYTKRMINTDLTNMMMIHLRKMINTFSARFVSSDQRSELV